MSSSIPTSSTASSEPKPKKLPSVPALYRGTFALLSSHAAQYFGYAGWMLLPLIGVVFTRITLGTAPASEHILAVLSGISIGLNVWVYANIAALTSSLIEHGKPVAPSPPFLVPFLVIVAYELLVLIGLPLLLLPGILFFTWFAYAPLIAALERGGFFASFLASRELVRGMFKQTLVRLLGIFLPVLTVYSLVIITVGLLYLQFFSLESAMEIPVSVDILLGLLEIALFPVTIIYLTLLYLARKSG